MTLLDRAPAAQPSVFTRGEAVWALEPNGPRYGQIVWDFGPIVTRMSQGERRIDFADIPDGYRADVTDLLMVLAQPDHPAVIEAGVVRRADPAPTYAVYGFYIRLRLLANWGAARSLSSFGAWRQQDCEDLLSDLQAGRHREDGHGLTPGTIRGYVEALKSLRDYRAVLPEGLSFQPWGARSANEVAGDDGRGVENETAPLPWDLWAPLLAASWAIVDRWSVDIIPAVQAQRELPARPAGPAAANAWRIVREWDANGGKVPLHTGFGRSPGERGEVNTTLFCRMLRINDSIFKPVHPAYRQEAVDLLVAAADDPARGVLGGLVEPTVLVTHDDGAQYPWVSEIGLGETEFLVSVLRAACYVVIACLTGMRDGEIQELTRDSITTRDGLAALASTEHKGNNDMDGENRAWWAPQPAIRACEVLAAVSPHSTYLFARSATNAASYNGDRDIPRLLAFVNGDPATRPGRGNGLALRRIETTDSDSINALTLRRSFAVYATTKPGAELGLGIQLGHSAWRMTSGYMSDGQQRSVQHLDGVRKGVLREQAAALIVGTSPVAGPASRHITAFRAQIIADPARAERIADTLADRLHFGLTNDCMWNPSTSGCGAERPRLGDHVCIGLDCTNALATEAHAPVYRDAVARIDAYLDQERGSAALRERMQRDRANTVRALRDLGHDPSAPLEA